MNKYPIWWDSDITVYNKYEDPQTNIITWFRTNLSGCFWKNVSEHILIGETVIETNTTICRVPKNIAYLDKSKWITIPNDKMSDYFTFGVGDIIVKGNVMDNISEYETGHRSSDILSKYKKYGECIVIQNCTNDTGAGRCNEHYRIRGV